MKFAIGIVLVLILSALAVAGVAMLRGGREGEPKRHTMMHALAWRIGLSVLLFVCLLVAYWFGWIQPTGLPLNR
ncbi:MAG: DUF2909 domain-containing protein [Rhizobacter sp.]|jgi:hypothetical protein|nr:DUF2909 domain-containing protein [Burkholderiaceae bacterium]MCO5124209.1 DUF2909 domain-containing protein [Rhizobacter sp.]